MITYDKLWKTMKEKQMTQYRLIRYYGFSAGQIGRLKKNMYVSVDPYAGSPLPNLELQNRGYRRVYSG